jgi:hypothetical protein
MALLFEPLIGHALLSGQFAGLPDDDQRNAQQEIAELLLGLSSPFPTDPELVEAVKLAVVLQINYQLQQGTEPETVKSMTQNHPGIMTSYRDRYLSPRAAAIVASLMHVKAVRWEVPTRGV